MNHPVLIIVLNLFVGIGAGFGYGMYLFWRRWFQRRLTEVEGDVDNLYRLHGLIPPGAERARRALGKPPWDEPTSDWPPPPGEASGRAQD